MTATGQELGGLVLAGSAQTNALSVDSGVMDVKRFGEMSSDFEDRVPDRLVLLARCVECQHPMADLIVAKDQIGTVDEIIANAWWDRDRKFKSPCTCDRPLPPVESLRREISQAKRKGIESRVAQEGAVAPSTARV